MGKAKGFLTYDEVNEHMPEASRRPLRWTTGCRRSSVEGIEIVDSSSKVKVAEKADAGGRDATRTKTRKTRRSKEEAKDEEDADRYSTTIDPVRMYLRKMGVGLAAHARGRGRDRQAHRGRRAARAAGRAELLGRDRGDPQPGRQAARAEDPRQGGRQGRRRGGRRVRRAVAHRACLQGHRQGPPALERAGEGRREAGREGRRRPPRRSTGARSTISSRRSWTPSRRCASSKKQIDRIVLKLKEFVERIERANARNHRLRAQVGPVSEGAPQDAARDPLVALATAGRRQEARHPPRRGRGDVAGHRRRAEEDKEGRGRGQAAGKRPARDRARDPGRRAHGREGQGES